MYNKVCKVMFVNSILVSIFSFCVISAHHQTRHHYRHHHKKHHDPVQHLYAKYTTESGEAADHEHLPESVIPTEYYLKLLPKSDGENLYIVGEIMILVHVTQNTSEVVLNSVGLEFNSSMISVYKTATPTRYTDPIKATDVRPGNNSEQVVVTFETVLDSDQQYNIAINYVGKSSDNMLGLYRSWYIDNEGELRWMLTTRMEAVQARTVFPCFDEPRFRTSFTVQLARPTKTFSVASMPQFKTTLPDKSIEGRVWDIYLKTPPIPTNLVAFSFVDVKFTRNDDLFIWAQPKVMDQAEYILNKTEIIMNTISEFTSILYNLPKINIMVVPDFDTDGTTSMGLLMMRERNALYKPKISTTLDRQFILSTYVEKLTYYWFGNLMTPQWWNYIWLNEGFSRYLKYYITSLIQPSWNMMEQFVVRELHTALSEDVGCSHSLNSFTRDPKFIDDVSDIYIFSKGAAIIRMLESIFHVYFFGTGVRNFLKLGIYDSGGVITPLTFWEAIRQTSPKNVLPDGVTIHQIMETWTKRNGYPLVTITRDYSKRTAVVTQEQFRIYNKEDESINHWWVPLTFMYNGKQSSDPSFAWLSRNESLKILINTDGWILCNIRQTGYYRVNYDEENWNLLTDQLVTNHTAIHPINRAQIIDDSFALAEAGIMKYDIPISLCYYLLIEKDYIPWLAAIKAFRRFYDRVYDTLTGESLKAYLQHLIKPIYKHLTKIPIAEQTHVDKLLIKEVTSFACYINLDECEKDLTDIFNQWVSTKLSYVLEPETKEAVLCTGIKLGSEQSWSDVWTYYKRSNVPTEKFLILQALACSTDENVIRRYLNLLTATKPPLDIRLQDYKYVFEFVISHSKNKNIALTFVLENYKLFLNKSKIRILKSLFELLGRYLINNNDFNKLQEFYNNTKEQLVEGNLNKVINNSLFKIRERIESKSILNTKEIAEYLDVIIKDILYLYRDDNVNNINHFEEYPEDDEDLNNENTNMTNPSTANTIYLNIYLSVSSFIIIVVRLVH